MLKQTTYLEMIASCRVRGLSPPEVMSAKAAGGHKGRTLQLPYKFADLALAIKTLLGENFTKEPPGVNG